MPEPASPDGRWFASIVEGNIVLRGRIDGLSNPLTQDGTPEHGWDIEAGVRNPFSPDGQHLFALRVDRRAVRLHLCWHPLQRDEQVSWVRFQRAGAALDVPEPHVVPVLGRAPLPVRLPDGMGGFADSYVRLLGWSDNGREVWFVRFDRLLSRADVFAASSRDGAARCVLSETSSTWVRLQHDVLWDGDCGFMLLPGGQGFIWLSDRDGFQRPHAFAADGTPRGALVQQPPPGLVVHHIDGVDTAGGWLYFHAGAEPRPYDRHFWRVPLPGGPAQRLSEGEGIHDARLAPDRQSFVDRFSSLREPLRAELRSADGRLIAPLHTAGIGRLLAQGWLPPQECTVTAADGATPLHGVLYLPHGFDSAQRYPVIEYVYGGPQIHNLPGHFGGGGTDGSGGRVERFVQALAQCGFVTLVLAARGTPGRGKVFQDAAYRSWSDHVVADHAGALAQLAQTRPWLDTTRVGVFGRSWGGYFSFRFLAERPDTYHAAVSIVPGFDPYAGILYEPYLGMPGDDAAPYEAASPFHLAAGLRGALMLVGGTRDFATIGDVMKMADALVQAQVHHELLLLPNQGHYATGVAADFADREVLRFFRAQLSPGKA
ncbi:MAG: DPP IV N-terminal domain-containing protein [Ideonella sp.]|nr:DPP IV N-terminal domain-containing protein [Ideonella sp.]